MKTIAIANQKGGTGKTTTAYNLGIALTQQGYRVLMVDFDPQGNLSCYCGIPPEQDLEQTITELLMKVAYEKPLSHRECVYQSKRTDDSAPQVDFIPSNLRLASFELAMGTMMCREVLLKTCLEQYSNQYDYCIIDCSPSVGLLLTNALSAANEVIIPMQAQPFSVVGMSQLTNSISNVQRKINPGLHIRGILLTMTQHTKVSEHYAHDVRAKYGRTLRVFTTEIPYNVKVQESQAFAAPTILYEPKSSSARAYEPEELIRTGPHDYKTATHSSLCISDNGLWHWYSRGIGGRGALNYLIQVKGMDFVSAVRHLCELELPAHAPFQPVKKNPQHEYAPRTAGRDRLL